MTSDLFCAFQPNRVIVPALPSRFSWPLISKAALATALASLLAMIVESAMASIRPAPNVGGGMRRIKLFGPLALRESGCEILQAGASVRPVMVERSCTPPSRMVLVGGFAYLNLASLTGPLEEMKNEMGAGFVAPFLVATAI